MSDNREPVLCRPFNAKEGRARYGGGRELTSHGRAWRRLGGVALDYGIFEITWIAWFLKHSHKTYLGQCCPMVRASCIFVHCVLIVPSTCPLIKKHNTCRSRKGGQQKDDKRVDYVTIKLEIHQSMEHARDSCSLKYFIILFIHNTFTHRY